MKRRERDDLLIQGPVLGKELTQAAGESDPRITGFAEERCKSELGSNFSTTK